MGIAYVLFETMPGEERRVLDELKKRDYVLDADIISGEYDLIAKIEGNSLDEIGYKVIELRALYGVEKTHTFPVLDLENI